MLPLVPQVMRQTRARVFRGDTRVEGKVLSVRAKQGPVSMCAGRKIPDSRPLAHADGYVLNAHLKASYLP
jgi:hypothetical protein